MNINILIVLYKKSLNDSSAYNTLMKKNTLHNNIRFIIWNNSPEIQFENGNFEYFESNNSTLPLIYNKMAKQYLENEDDFLMISDDDTDYSNYNFEELFEILKKYKNEVGVFIPQLYANNRLVSPGKRFLFKGKYIDKIDSGLINSKNTLGMNSGLIITYKCFKKMPFLFDERLNFYGTDTDFFIRYEKYFKYLYVLPFKIIHDLSENSNDNNRSLFRFNDDTFAIKHTFRNKSVWIKTLLVFFIFYKAIKLSIKYRNLEFLRSFL